MATYSELFGLQNDEGMRNKVRVALSVSAEEIRSGGDTVDPPWDQTAGAHDARVAWVKNQDAFNPAEELVQTVWNGMLAANASASVATILAAPDTGAGSIQNNVDAMVDILANGETV